MQEIKISICAILLISLNILTYCFLETGFVMSMVFLLAFDKLMVMFSKEWNEKSFFNMVAASSITCSITYISVISK